MADKATEEAYIMDAFSSLVCPFRISSEKY
jgi:hypothetical protein